MRRIWILLLGACAHGSIKPTPTPALAPVEAALPREFPGRELPFYHGVAVVGDFVVLGLPACPDFADDLPQCGVGQVLVFRRDDLANPVQTITATAEDTHFGWFPSALGDVDGDGFRDVAFVARDATYVYCGAADGLATPPILLPPNHVVPGGDVDGDGAAEIVMIESDAITLYRGGAGGPSDSRKEAIALPSLAEPYGEVTAADLDGDGYGDLAIKIEIEHGPTQVLIFRGSRDGLSPDPS